VEPGSVSSLGLAAARASDFSGCGVSVMGVSAGIIGTAVFFGLGLYVCDSASGQDADAFEYGLTELPCELLVLLLSVHCGLSGSHGSILSY
jgi:hypothetical protein